MNAKSVIGRRLAALSGVVLLAVPVASAQQAGGISGTVRDISGGVLPGVTVEAASPALIEKARTAVTDSEGRYNIVDLRPGVYSVTFTLTGFSTLRREGIELTSGFTAAVNSELRVSSLEETITVTGASPLVDTQNVRQQTLVSDELLKTLPSGSLGLMGLARMIPGMSGGAEMGGAAGIYAANNPIFSWLHGKAGVKSFFDGMQTNNFAGTGAQSYVMNTAAVEETVIETAGGSAESSASGVSINLIPKDGGNEVSAGFIGTYSTESLQADNLTDELLARGVTTTPTLLRLYDGNMTVGGPLQKDRLWFFAATRFSGTRNQVAGVYFNKTQGTPIYTPDLDRPAYRQEWLRSQSVRLSWQVSPRNKVGSFTDLQTFQVRGQARNEAPEAHYAFSFFPAGVFQVSWSSPVTSRLLFEAGASLAKNDWPITREQATDVFGFTVKETDVSVLEASTGFRYNAKSGYSSFHSNDRWAERFAVSYVTGSHAWKIGFQLQQHVEDDQQHVNSDLGYTMNLGRPSSVTMFATPYVRKNRTKADLGLYVQDQWRVRRLTLNYGLRLDYFNGSVPEQHVDAGRFVGARDFAAVSRVPEWTDLDPRVGASYDLFGTGRTAIKASFGRYVGRMSTLLAAANNPINTSVNSVNRTWTDANADFVLDCDLHNLAANGECGPISNLNFGRNNPNATRFTDDVIRGFGKRDYLWDMSAEVQQQFGQRVSTTFGYYRNWSHHMGTFGHAGTHSGVTDNLAVTPADFDPYCITAPRDPRLPDGGGYQVCGLYDVKPAKFGQVNNIITRPSHYGDGMWHAADFFTVSLSSRFGSGIELGGSLDTGRTVDDNCYVIDSPQQLLNCRIVTPFKAQTQIKVHGSYPLPGGFVVSSIFQNVSGIEYQANYAVPNDLIAPSLGRPLAACGTRTVCPATATVPLIPPQTQFEPRRTVLDLRMSRIFRIGARARVRANVDVYNLLNDSSVVGQNNNYGTAAWRLPIGVQQLAGGMMGGRLFQFGGQITY